MAEKFQGDPDWLIFGHVSGPEPMTVVRRMGGGRPLRDLLEGVGRISLLSVPQRMHSLLERECSTVRRKGGVGTRGQSTGSPCHTLILQLVNCALRALTIEPSEQRCGVNASSVSVELMNK